MAPAASSTLEARVRCCRRAPAQVLHPHRARAENNTRVACARRRTSRLARLRTGRRYALALETRTPILDGHVPQARAFGLRTVEVARVRDAGAGARLEESRT